LLRERGRQEAEVEALHAIGRSRSVCNFCPDVHFLPREERMRTILTKLSESGHITSIDKPYRLNSKKIACDFRVASHLFKRWAIVVGSMTKKTHGLEK
jgi:hypothetical protein